MLQLTHTHSQLENPALPPDAAVTRGLTLKTCNEQQTSKNQNRHEPPHIHAREKKMELKTGDYSLFSHS